MHIQRDFPHTVRVIQHVWIPLRDGKRLAARIWLPKDAAQNPVPALLEYLPYRKNDGTRWRDSIRHPYLAGYGYAAVRVDMRGCGDSDGLMLDEYTSVELDDACQVLAWLEAQPWCTGNVGIFGKSWGGFNALQIAALRPPQLKAIITIASTDDRYADDVHYMGGCMLGSQMLSWASTMLAYNATLPDPDVVGDSWRKSWRHRLNTTPPFGEIWLSHQRRDGYWQHGSVCEDGDQRGDNALSLCYTTVEQPETAVLGHPRIMLSLRVDQPQAALGVRLCDVAPGGESALVSWGLYNLSHRHGHANPEPMPLDTAVSVTVPLKLLGHTLKQNHRWQVAISPTFWPHLWPSPHPVSLTIESCALVLPIRMAGADDGILRPFSLPACAAPIDVAQISPSDSAYSIQFDRIQNSATIIHRTDSGNQRFPDGLSLWDVALDQFEIMEHNPLSAQATSKRTRTLGRGDWQVRIITHSEMTSDATNFYVYNHLTAYEGDQTFFERVWNKTIPRDFQ